MGERVMGMTGEKVMRMLGEMVIRMLREQGVGVKKRTKQWVRVGRRRDGWRFLSWPLGLAWPELRRLPVREAGFIAGR